MEPPIANETRLKRLAIGRQQLDAFRTSRDAARAAGGAGAAAAAAPARAPLGPLAQATAPSPRGAAAKAPPARRAAPAVAPPPAPPADALGDENMDISSAADEPGGLAASLARAAATWRGPPGTTPTAVPVSPPTARGEAVRLRRAAGSARARRARLTHTPSPVHPPLQPAALPLVEPPRRAAVDSAARNDERRRAERRRPRRRGVGPAF
jgi:hypothetical protein